jgi:hypothetical protein
VGLAHAQGDERDELEHERRAAPRRERARSVATNMPVADTAPAAVTAAARPRPPTRSAARTQAPAVQSEAGSPEVAAAITGRR